MQINKIVVIHNILWYYLHMEYKLIRSKRKSISIKIDNSGQIIVRAPKTASIMQIETCLLKKASWIKLCIKKVQDDLKKIQHYQNNIFLLFGEEIRIFETNNYYIINDEKFRKAKKTLHDIVKKYLIQKAKEYIIPKTNEIAKELSITNYSISFMSAKCRWGSCSNKQHLKFNYKLAMLPQNLINYVICHELCHTIEFNHSKKFWILLEKLGYKKTDVKKMFNEYNFVLQLF